MLHLIATPEMLAATRRPILSIPAAGPWIGAPNGQVAMQPGRADFENGFILGVDLAPTFDVRRAFRQLPRPVWLA